MNKKKIAAIVAIIIVLIGVITTIIIYNKNKEDLKNTVIDINMEELDEKISTNGGFDSSKNTTIDKGIAVSSFSLEESSIQEVIGRLPLINIKASMYVVIKASDGKTEYVKEKLEEYATNYETQWSNYLENEYNLVKKRQIGIKGNYVYLIIADNTNDLVNLIK